MGKAKIYSKLEAVTAEGILGDAAQIGTAFRFKSTENHPQSSVEEALEALSSRIDAKPDGGGTVEVEELSADDINTCLKNQNVWPDDIISY